MFVVLTMLFGCTKKTGEEITLRYLDFKVYDPVYVGIEKGFFQKAGINVVLQNSTLAGPTAIQVVASGRAEGGLASIPALINATSAGLPVLGVSDIQSALPGQPLEEYFVKNESHIKSLNDLPGSRFAVNLWKSSFHYTALMALDQKGISIETVKFALLPFDKQLPAIMNGSVDVVGLMEPYANYLRTQGGYRVLFDANDIFGTKQFTLHFVNSIWARENPKAATAFVSGIVESINWIEANQDEAKKIISKYTGVDEKYVPVYHFQKNGVVIMDDVSFWMDFMKSIGDLNAGWLKPEDIATNVYNNKAQ